MLGAPGWVFFDSIPCHGAEGTTFEFPPKEAVAQFLADFRTWCLSEEAAKLAHQLPTIALSA